MSPILTVVLLPVAAAVAGALGFYLGGENRKRTAEAKIGSAEEEAKRIVNDAIKAAEQKRKETIIEAKDEAFKLKSDADKEIKDRRAEITRQERRIPGGYTNVPHNCEWKLLLILHKPESGMKMNHLLVWGYDIDFPFSKKME